MSSLSASAASAAVVAAAAPPEAGRALFFSQGAFQSWLGVIINMTSGRPSSPLTIFYLCFSPPLLSLSIAVWRQ